MHFVYGLVKISVTLFYKRVFITPRFHYWANATLIAVSMWIISAFFVRIMKQNRASHIDISSLYYSVRTGFQASGPDRQRNKKVY